MAINQKYSFKDFKGQDLSGVSTDEFNGKGDIVGSCFAQEFAYGETIPLSGGKSIFPSGMTGVTFKRCNLDNVELPEGNTVTSDAGINSTKKTVQQQNDLEDWEMEYSGGWIPKVPVRAKAFDQYGLSKYPSEIPATKQDKSPVEEARELEKLGG